MQGLKSLNSRAMTNILGNTILLINTNAFESISFLIQSEQPLE